MIADLKSFIVPIRQSTCKDCRACLRKCLFKHKLGLVPAKMTKLRRAANLGDLVHRFMELGSVTPETETTVRTELDALLQPYRDAVNKDEDVFGDAASAIKDAYSNLEKAKAMVQVFQERYPDDPDLEVVAREQDVQVRLQIPGSDPKHPRYLWLAGTMDKLYHSRSTNRYWVQDYKNTGRAPEDIWVGYEWGPQLRIYRLLANAWLHLQMKDPALNVSGFILDILQAPTIIMSGSDRNFTVSKKVLKSGPRKGQEVEEKEYYGDPVFANYLQRVREWYNAGQAEGKLAPCTRLSMPFVESPLPFDFVSFLMGTRVALMMPILKAKIEDIAIAYPRDPSGEACRKFETTCDYYPLCTNEPSKWEAMIQTSYKQVEPNLYIEESEYVDQPTNDEPYIIVPNRQPSNQGDAGNDTPRILGVGG